VHPEKISACARMRPAINLKCLFIVIPLEINIVLFQTKVKRGERVESGKLKVESGKLKVES
jgi:hypothetical protein